MGVSACLICYNEQDLILNCLDWLNSLNNLDEICVLDSYSTDKTWDLVCNFKSDKIYVIKQQKFNNFGQQKNDCILMATGKWILLIDADETYSYKMDKLLGDINSEKLESYNAFRMMTMVTCIDKKHTINLKPNDPHVRIWRRGFCLYSGECHEMLYAKNNRNLHSSYNKDILNLYNTKEYNEIVLLHHQRLKSREALIEKGKRWAEYDMLRKSAEAKLPVDEMSWVRTQDEVKLGKKKMFLIPPTYRDYKDE